MNSKSSQGAQFILVVGGCSCIALGIAFAFGPMAQSWHYGPGAPLSMLFCAFCYFSIAFKNHDKNADKALIVVAIAAFISAIVAVATYFSKQ